jgi:hypothetical protein
LHLNQSGHIGRLSSLLGFVGRLIDPVLFNDLVGDGLDFGLVGSFLLDFG